MPTALSQIGSFLPEQPLRNWQSRGFMYLPERMGFRRVTNCSVLPEPPVTVQVKGGGKHPTNCDMLAI